MIQTCSCCDVPSLRRTRRGTTAPTFGTDARRDRGSTRTNQSSPSLAHVPRKSGRRDMASLYRWVSDYGFEDSRGLAITTRDDPALVITCARLSRTHHVRDFVKSPLAVPPDMTARTRAHPPLSLTIQPRSTWSALASSTTHPGGGTRWVREPRFRPQTNATVHTTV